MAMATPGEMQDAPRPGRRRKRLGLRGMMGMILVFGLAIGWLAGKQRQGREDAVLLADLARQGVHVNSRDATLLCLVAMKVLRTDNIGVEARLGDWIGPWWFNRPVGFNAGMMSEAKASRVAERLRRFGSIHEVCFHSASLNGLRLFYVDKVPVGQLGPDGGTCTFRTFDGSAAGPASPSVGRSPKP